MQMFNNYAGITDGTMGDLKLYIEGGNMHLYDNAIAKYNKDIDDLNTRLDKAKKSDAITAKVGQGKSTKVQQIEDEINAYKKEHSVIRKLSAAMGNIVDQGERDKLYELWNNIAKIDQIVEMTEGKIIKGNNKANKITGNIDNKTDQTKILSADADYWAKQLINDRGKLDQAAGSMQPIKIPIEMDENIEEELLPKSELEIKLKARLEGVDFAKKQISELEQLLSVAQTPDEKSQISGMISQYKTQFKLFDKKDIDVNNDYAESLNSISSIFGSLSGVMDDSSASVLQWGANFLSTIGQAIPAIVGMMSVKTADTAVTNANTTAEVANAGSKILSAHSGIPFVGVALGIAGVASIIAAMASMPKFANGGIVPGTFSVGDKVLAGLNSGEMVLNAGQQSKLFRMLNSGSTSGSQNINIGFDRVKGTDLLLTINNTLKSQGKKSL